MGNEQLIEELNERIKELTCLYEISNITSDNTLSFEKQLQAIVNYLPKAWKHPNSAIAQLAVHSTTYYSNVLTKDTVKLSKPIVVNDAYIGDLSVHYDSATHSQADFLAEENVLLKTLAQEIASVISKKEQHEREQTLQRKFQHSDRLNILGEITAGICHELNTPLGNILGFSQLIQEKATDGQIKKDIEKIINSAMHSREVVKKLMFFSCEMPQHIQMVDVNVLIIEAIDLLKFSINNKGLSLDYKNDTTNLLAPLDPVQFTQVVFNLLINAIHASKHGNSIEVQLSQADEHLELYIRDYGTGILPEIQEKIFEPFFTTKPVGEGSGLGLSVVHGIVKSHGGEITVSSEINKGTTFKVKFPLKHG